MFGRFNRGRVLALRDKGLAAPRRTVTVAEFTALATAAGWSADEIKTQLIVAKHLGSGLLVGAEVLEVSDDA